MMELKVLMARMERRELKEQKDSTARMALPVRTERRVTSASAAKRDSTAKRGATDSRELQA